MINRNKRVQKEARRRLEDDREASPPENSESEYLLIAPNKNKKFKMIDEALAQTATGYGAKPVLYVKQVREQNTRAIPTKVEHGTSGCQCHNEILIKTPAAPRTQPKYEDQKVCLHVHNLHNYDSGTEGKPRPHIDIPSPEAFYRLTPVTEEDTNVTLTKVKRKQVDSRRTPSKGVELFKHSKRRSRSPRSVSEDSIASLGESEKKLRDMEQSLKEKEQTMLYNMIFSQNNMIREISKEMKEQRDHTDELRNELKMWRDTAIGLERANKKKQIELEIENEIMQEEQLLAANEQKLKKMIHQRNKSVDDRMSARSNSSSASSYKDLEKRRHTHNSISFDGNQKTKTPQKPKAYEEVKVRSLTTENKLLKQEKKMLIDELANQSVKKLKFQADYSPHRDKCCHKYFEQRYGTEAKASKSPFKNKHISNSLISRTPPRAAKQQTVSTVKKSSKALMSDLRKAIKKHRDNIIKKEAEKEVIDSIAGAVANKLQVKMRR